MLGLTQSLRDSFSLAAWEAGFERDQAALSTYLLAERLIEAADAEAPIEVVIEQLTAELQQPDTPESNYTAAREVLALFINSRLSTGSADTA